MLQTGPQKIDLNQKHGINPLVAGLAGALAGAAGITAFALADKDIREKVIKRTKEVKSSLQKWSEDKLNDVKNESNKIMAVGEEESQMIEKKQEN